MKMVPGHDCVMIFDEAENTCCESVVTYFTKNSNNFEHFHQNHYNMYRPLPDTVDSILSPIIECSKKFLHDMFVYKVD